VRADFESTANRPVPSNPNPNPVRCRLAGLEPPLHLLRPPLERSRAQRDETGEFNAISRDKRYLQAISRDFTAL